MNLDFSKLTNIKILPDGWQAGCPQCFRENHDLEGRNHLKIWKASGRFCCIAHQGDAGHHGAIKAILSKDGDTSFSDYEIIDPEPKITHERVYPDASLAKLMKDHSYWVARGVKEQVLSRMEGGLAPLDEKSKLSYRYIFPIRNMSGKITGFSGRLVDDLSFGPKYKHLVKSSLACYPWYQYSGKYIKEMKSAVLLEGVSDFLTLASHDINNCLILFGLNINSKIISSLISAGVSTIYISTNNDNIDGGSVANGAGNHAAMKLKNKLSNFFNEDSIIIRLPRLAKDWNISSIEDINAFKLEINNLNTIQESLC